eukprot:103538-Rhodomonas_salina.1
MSVDKGGVLPSARQRETRQSKRSRHSHWPNETGQHHVRSQHHTPCTRPKTLHHTLATDTVCVQLRWPCVCVCLSVCVCVSVCASVCVSVSGRAHLAKGRGERGAGAGGQARVLGAGSLLLIEEAPHVTPDYAISVPHVTPPYAISVPHVTPYAISVPHVTLPYAISVPHLTLPYAISVVPLSARCESLVYRSCTLQGMTALYVQGLFSA